MIALLLLLAAPQDNAAGIRPSSETTPVAKLPPANPLPLADPDVANVMAPINAMFAGLAAHDAAAISAQVVPEGGATVAIEKADGSREIKHLSWSEFTAGIKPGADSFEERLTDPAVEQRIGFAHFESITWRAFKLPLEDRCEDYGQVATYLGTLPHQPHAFDLDDDHHFETGRPLPVCGNTADMLGATRYARHFRVDGDKQRHFGLFDCAPATPTATGTGGACC